MFAVKLVRWLTPHAVRADVVYVLWREFDFAEKEFTTMCVSISQNKGFLFQIEGPWWSGKSPFAAMTREADHLLAHPEIMLEMEKEYNEAQADEIEESIIREDSLRLRRTEERD
jgi:hypothetical protein